jgi:hypothetical protein
MADAAGVAITLTVNAGAFRLSPGTYGPGVGFTNVTNGRGSTTRSAKLIVHRGSQQPTASHFITDDRGGFLLGDRHSGILGAR